MSDVEVNALIELFELADTDDQEKVGQLATEYMYLIRKSKNVIFSIIDRMPKSTADLLRLSYYPANEENRAQVNGLVNEILTSGHRTPGKREIMKRLFTKYKLFDLFEQFCEYFHIKGADAELIKSAFDKKDIDLVKYYHIHSTFYWIPQKCNPTGDHFTAREITFETLNAGVDVDRLTRSDTMLKYKFAQLLFMGWHVAFNPVNNLLYDLSINVVRCFVYANIRVIRIIEENGKPRYELVGLAQEFIGVKVYNCDNPSYSLNVKIELFEDYEILAIEAEHISIAFTTANMKKIDYVPDWSNYVPFKCEQITPPIEDLIKPEIIATPDDEAAWDLFGGDGVNDGNADDGEDEDADDAEDDAEDDAKSNPAIGENDIDRYDHYYKDDSEDDAESEDYTESEDYADDDREWDLITLDPPKAKPAGVLSDEPDADQSWFRVSGPALEPYSLIIYKNIVYPPSKAKKLVLIEQNE